MTVEWIYCIPELYILKVCYFPFEVYHQKLTLLFHLEVRARFQYVLSVFVHMFQSFIKLTFGLLCRFFATFVIKILRLKILIR